LKEDKWMAVNYNKLFLLLKEKKMSNIDLQKQAGFSGNIITRIKRNEYIRLQSIESICKVLDCRVDDILDFVSDEI
jgi:putative transcriptional regulator